MQIIEVKKVNNDIGKKPRVVAYARVSTEYEGQMGSFDNQIEIYTSKIMANPEWEFAGVYADPAITGTTGDRPEFKRMLLDAEKHKIDIILCKSISRFARNTLLSIETIRHLGEIGVRVIFEKERIDTGLAYSEMMFTIMSAFAQEESRNISERVRKGIYFRAMNGETFWTPMYGYTRKDGKDFVVDEDKAKIVRRIFSEYDHGYSLRRIMGNLNAEGIPAPRGGRWSMIEVANIISNEKYIGDVLTNKYYIKDYISHKQVRNKGEVEQVHIKEHHKPIIAYEQYERVQLIRKMKSEGTYPYKGRLACPICGGRLEYEADALGPKRAVWKCDADLFFMQGRKLASALIEAYRQMDPGDTGDEAAKEIKRENPEFESVEAWWLDALVESIAFGRHEGREDQTMTIDWICGKRTTVTTGNGPMYRHRKHYQALKLGKEKKPKETKVTRIAATRDAVIDG